MSQDTAPRVAPAPLAHPPRGEFEGAAVGLAVTDAEGRFLQVNAALCAMVGHTAPELLALDLLAITHPDDRAPDHRLLAQLVGGQIATFCLEKRLLKRGGEPVPVRLSASLQPAADGGTAQVLAVCQDLGARRPAVFEQHRYPIDLIPGVVWTAQPDGMIDYANEYWTNYTGLTLEHTRGWAWTSRVHPDDLPRVTEVWKGALATGDPVEVDYRLRHVSDGAYRWFLARGQPLRDHEGRIVRWFGTLTDIEEQRRLERERVEMVKARDRSTALTAEIALALNEAPDLSSMAQRCCEILDRHLEAAFVRLWLLPEGENVLELRGSAGMYTRLNGTYSRIPVGGFRVGMIAQERRPLLINRVIGDERIPEQEWAQQEGMVAFAGHPLMCGEHLVGVVAMFAKRKLDPEVIELLAAVSGAIALGLERKRAEHQLREARWRADQANRAKSEFLSRMSHELRTPLNSIMGFTNLMLMGLPGPLNAEQHKQLGMVDSSSRLLLALINDLLDLSGIEAGKVAVKWEWFEVQPMVRDVVASLEPQVQARKLEVLTDLPAGPLSVHADRRKCHQILLNLLTNAVKFTDSGTITVAAATLAERFEISVIDTGIGIPPETLARLFAPFARAEDAVLRRVEGTGLGLHVSRELAHLMGGEIRAESAPGKGSRFTLSLPVVALPAVALPAVAR